MKFVVVVVTILSFDCHNGTIYSLSEGVSILEVEFEDVLFLLSVMD